jgi:epimerase transport system membrane fusion protein
VTAPARPDLPPAGVRGPLTLGLGVMIVFLGGALAWSAAVPMQSAATAPGVVVVDSNRKTVAHLDGGTVAELMVQEGQVVKAGQILIRLDRTVPAANLALLRGQLIASLALQARLAAQRDREPELRFPAMLREFGADDPQVIEAMTAERRVHAALNDQMDSQIRILQQKNGQIDEQIRGFQAQIQAFDSQLRLITEETTVKEELVGKGLAPKPQLSMLQRQAAEIEGSRGQHVAKIAEARQQIGEGELRIVDLKAQVLSESVQKLRDEQTRAYEIIQRLRAAEDTLRRTEIPAPASGQVVGLKVFTVGGVIGPREPLMDIVPGDDLLSVDAQVSITDIDVISVGLPVELRFSAFNQRTTPTLAGKVQKISADRVVDQRTGQPSYTVRIMVETTGRLPPGIELQAGMPVEAMIRTGERTFLDYLTKPISDFTNRAMRES